MPPPPFRNGPQPQPQFQRLARHSLLALAALLPSTAQAGGSLLIWPVHPVIKADSSAAALWLENPGDEPITMQVQSYAWAQENGQDVYAPQKEVVATPPIVRLEPRGKQLVRLTRLGPPPAQPERAYRLIVDELPAPDAKPSSGAAVQFRMRYSLPLFSYGAPSSADAPPPQLAWRIRSAGDDQIIEITNSGHGHARLTSASLSGSGQTLSLGEGLLGYVLSGGMLLVSLPDHAPSFRPAELTMSVNGSTVAVIAKAAL